MGFFPRKKFGVIFFFEMEPKGVVGFFPGSLTAHLVIFMKLDDFQWLVHSPTEG